jgi:hypothetical protein
MVMVVAELWPISGMLMMMQLMASFVGSLLLLLRLMRSLMPQSLYARNDYQEVSRAMLLLDLTKMDDVLSTMVPVVSSRLNLLLKSSASSREVVLTMIQTLVATREVVLPSLLPNAQNRRWGEE